MTNALGRASAIPRSPDPLPRHPDAPDPQGQNWKEWTRSQERPIAVDLFCGAGGLSHGLETAGYRVALSVDTDPWSLESHRHNFPGDALAVDLSTAEGLGVPVFRGGGLLDSCCRFVLVSVLEFDRCRHAK